MPDVMLRLLQASWNGLPVASLAIFANRWIHVPGHVHVDQILAELVDIVSSTPARVDCSAACSRWHRSSARSRRRRLRVANQGSASESRELAGHGATFGGPGSGKTTFLQLLVEASADQQPIVIVDPKGSPALEATVRAHGGQVWTLDGRLPADLLDARPWQVPDLLFEAEDYSPDARVFRDAAHQRALWAAWALMLQDAPMDLASLRRLS